VNSNAALVITTINSPNATLLQVAEGCHQHKIRMIVIGDSKSPSNFHIPGVEYYGLKAQRDSGLAYAKLCPERHYARKNIGYLLACRGGAEVIIETDDDNLPTPDFWQTRQRYQEVEAIEESGWLNVYRYFTDDLIWPRGLPLSKIQRSKSPVTSASVRDCPIQQGLANENPDVDAIFRLTLPLPFNFSKRATLALGRGVWCPFNSQNTTWFRDSFPLLYLPSYCSFRMTDIWRSFVAQRLSWEMDWALLFHSVTVWQDRNDHDLMRDFSEEIPGYLNNEAIGEELEKLTLKKGGSAINDNLRSCYVKLNQMGLVSKEELALVDAWVEDISVLSHM
jgi:hypothetical protein